MFRRRQFEQGELTFTTLAIVNHRPPTIQDNVVVERHLPSRVEGELTFTNHSDSKPQATNNSGQRCRKETPAFACRIVGAKE
jgi:hypothetical protein